MRFLRSQTGKEVMHRCARDKAEMHILWRDRSLAGYGTESPTSKGSIEKSWYP